MTDAHIFGFVEYHESENGTPDTFTTVHFKSTTAIY